VPFEVSFQGREDLELPTLLEQELPGILAWAVEGCLAWQRDGLGEAEAVTRATLEYRQDEDALGAFFAECCEASGETGTTELREAYEEFCRELGEKPLGARMLGKRLAERGIERGGAGRRSYVGVSLTPRVTSSDVIFSNPPRVRARKGVTDNDVTTRHSPTSEGASKADLRRNGAEELRDLDDHSTETLDRMRQMGITPVEDEA
jgi:phage/plasmid-associated DNA primase